MKREDFRERMSETGEDELTRQLKAALDSEDFKLARSLLESGLANNPKDRSLLILAGDLDSKQSRFSDALKNYEKALEISPPDTALEEKIEKTRRKKRLNNSWIVTFLFGVPIVGALIHLVDPGLGGTIILGWGLIWIFFGIVIIALRQYGTGTSLVLTFSLVLFVATISDVYVALGIFPATLLLVVAGAALDSRKSKDMGPVARLFSGTFQAGEVTLGYRYHPLTDEISDEDSTLTALFPERVKVDRPYPLAIRPRGNGPIHLRVVAPECVPPEIEYRLKGNAENQLTTLLIPKKGGATIISVIATDQDGSLLAGRQLVSSVSHDLVTAARKYVPPIGAIVAAVLGIVLILQQFLLA